MEPELAKQPEIATPKPLEFQVGSSTVKAVLDGKKISIRAYSELSAKLFEGVLEESDFSEQEKFVFEDSEAVYIMMEECAMEKRKIQLSDAGVLTFQYFFQPNKRSQVERTLEVKLKEVEIGESQRLAKKVDKFETEVKELEVFKEKVKRMENATEKLRLYLLERLRF